MHRIYIDQRQKMILNRNIKLFKNNQQSAFLNLLPRRDRTIFSKFPLRKVEPHKPPVPAAHSLTTISGFFSVT